MFDRFNSRVRAGSPEATGAGWTDSPLPLSSFGSEETGYQNIVYDYELLLPSHKYVSSHLYVTMVMMMLGEGHACYYGDDGVGGGARMLLW